MRRAVVGLSAILLAAVVCLAGQSPKVISGSATFQQDGADWTITTSERTVISWNSFNVPAGSTTRFIQPSQRSVVINRVRGTSASFIDGLLTANGRLALINSNGIRIGATGVVRAHSFIASTLAGVSNEQIFVGKDLSFTGNSRASIENHGRIEALGGDVYLIAQRVQNKGTVVARRGRVGIAAGREVLLTQDGELFVKPSLEDAPVGGTGVNNGGVIEAVQARLEADGNMYALAINTRGIVRATGAVRLGDGRIVLRSVGGTVRTGGELIARTADETGATRGGEVRIVARDIQVGGSTTIDVSGETGGGKVQIGGADGAERLAGAERTYIASGARIMAEAVNLGDGGEVIVWADGATEFAGAVSVRGGELGGDGGFVEVSGREWLGFHGTVDTSAPKGALGALILDPKDIVIRPGSGDGAANGAGSFSGPGRAGGVVERGDSGPSVIYQSELEGLSGTTNVRIEARDNVTMEPFGGDTNPLTFASGTGTIALLADSDGNGVGDFAMDSGDRIVTNGRSLRISGRNVTVGRIDTGGGELELMAGGDLRAGDLTAGELRAGAGQLGAGSANIFGRIKAYDVAIVGGGGDDKFAFKAIASNGGLVVAGRGGNDTFIFRDVGGMDVAGKFTVKGGGQSYGVGDELKLSKGSFESVECSFSRRNGKGNDGCIELTDGEDGWALWFEGLEPITDKLAAVDRVFTLSDDDQSATRANDAVAGCMVFEGRGFETTVFKNPGGSLKMKKGGGGDDCLVGGRGNDRHWGGGGNDTLCGGRGNDRLWEERGCDLLGGGSGDDKLWGGRGSDVLCSDGGKERLWGGRGDDKLCGGRGDDIFCKGRRSGRDEVCGGAGHDKFIKHRDGFWGFCNRRCPPKPEPEPPGPGPGPEAFGERPARVFRLPVWWDLTNRTREWVRGSQEGHIVLRCEPVVRPSRQGRFWVQPMADVLLLMNSYFEAVVCAREHMHFYGWR